MTLSDDLKSWFTSVTIVSAIISGLCNALSMFFHWEFPIDFAPNVATGIVGIVTAITAIIGRIKAVKKIG